MLPDGQKDLNIYSLCKHIIIRLANEDVEIFSITQAMSEILSLMGYGECHSYSECVSIAEDIMGKKLPVGVI